MLDMLIGSGAALLLVAAVVAVVVRRRRRKSRPHVGLTDEMLQRIQADGWLEAEEPLDLGEAAAEEEQFWKDERWDKPDEL